MVALKAYEVDRFVSTPRPAHRVILLYGPDQGLVTEQAEKLALATGCDLSDPFSVIRFDADALASDRSRLSDEADTISMFGGERLIRVSGATRKNLLECIKPLLEAPPRDAYVIIEGGDLDNRNATRLAFEKSKTAMALPCYQDDAKAIAGLIKQEITDHGFKINQETMDFLAPFLGGDRLASRNELKKLALYALGENEITIEHILEIVGDASLTDPNQLIDSVARGNLDRLETDLDRVFADGLSPDMLLIMTLRHFQLLHELRSKMELNRASAKGLVDTSRPPIFIKRRNDIVYALSRLGSTLLEKIVSRLQSAAFEARAHPELGKSLAGTTLLAIALEVRAAA